MDSNQASRLERLLKNVVVVDSKHPCDLATAHPHLCEFSHGDYKEDYHYQCKVKSIAKACEVLVPSRCLSSGGSTCEVKREIQHGAAAREAKWRAKELGWVSLGRSVDDEMSDLFGVLEAS